MYIELGIIDTIWDVSLDIDEHHAEIVASTPLEIGHRGWYRSWVTLPDATIRERRMLPDGNYDAHPETNRPNMRLIVDAIPLVHTEVIRALKVAYGLE